MRALAAASSASARSTSGRRRSNRPARRPAGPASRSHRAARPTGNHAVSLPGVRPLRFPAGGGRASPRLSRRNPPRPCSATCASARADRVCRRTGGLPVAHQLPARALHHRGCAAHREFARQPAQFQRAPAVSAATLVCTASRTGFGGPGIGRRPRPPGAPSAEQVKLPAAASMPARNQSCWSDARRRAAGSGRSGSRRFRCEAHGRSRKIHARWWRPCPSVAARVRVCARALRPAAVHGSLPGRRDQPVQLGHGTAATRTPVVRVSGPDHGLQKAAGIGLRATRNLGPTTVQPASRLQRRDQPLTTTATLTECCSLNSPPSPNPSHEGRGLLAGNCSVRAVNQPVAFT